MVNDCLELPRFLVKFVVFLKLKKDIYNDERMKYPKMARHIAIWLFTGT